METEATKTSDAVSEGAPEGRQASLHPGVKLKAPNAKRRQVAWAMRYIDPETGKEKNERIDPERHPTERHRIDCARRKSTELASKRRKMETRGNDPASVPIPVAIKAYYEKAADLRDKTKVTYETSTDIFVEWTRKTGVRATGDLTRQRLDRFRTFAYSYPARRAVRTADGAKLVPTKRRRSPITVNRDLRVMRTVLGWLRRTDQLPHLTTEDLEIVLVRYREDHETPEWMTPDEIGEVLQACLRHDADVYAMTRKEKTERNWAGHATEKYKPIAPFVLTSFLAGMRAAEMCLIDWRIHVRLGAQNMAGVTVGEIKLRAQDTKTHRARDVCFDVSAVLRELFVAMHELSKGRGSVFDLTYDEADTARSRLIETYGAPARFTYQLARSTCSSYLTNAPGIYGSAAPFHSAKQLGHSVTVAEKNYAGLIKGIPLTANTLEAAMKIEDVARAIVARVKGDREIAPNVIAIR